MKTSQPLAFRNEVKKRIQLRSFRKLHVRCVVQENAIVLCKIIWRECLVVFSKIHLKRPRFFPQCLYGKVPEGNRLVNKATATVKNENTAFFSWLRCRLLGHCRSDCLTCL